MDPFAFLIVDMITWLPVFNLFATLLYMIVHGLSFMLFSYTFLEFSLAVHIVALHFWRQFRNAFCVLSLTFKSSVFFNLLLYKFVCFFMFFIVFLQDRKSMLSFAIRLYYIFLGMAFSQALIIQFMNFVVTSFGLLERLDGFVLTSFLRSFSQYSLLAADCTMIFSVLLLGSDASTACIEV